MDRQTEFRNGLTLTLALVAALTGSYFLLNSPLVSLRPDQGATLYDLSTQSQFVRARLWQDPLLVIHEDWKARIESNDASALAIHPFRVLDLPEGLRVDAKQKLLRLLVLQGEESYAENIEERRRQRYALVSALTSSDYVPDDEAHIGYFIAPQFNPAEPTLAAQPSPSPNDVLIGYETFTYSREPGAMPEQLEANIPQKVQVLWLNATDFDEYTFPRLEGLLTFMNRCAPTQEAGGDCGQLVENVVLGPDSTGDLSALMRQQAQEAMPGLSPLEARDRYSQAYYAQLVAASSAASEALASGEELRVQAASSTLTGGKAENVPMPGQATDGPALSSVENGVRPASPAAENADNPASPSEGLMEPGPASGGAAPSRQDVESLLTTREHLHLVSSRATGPLDKLAGQDLNPADFSVVDRPSMRRAEAALARHLNIKTYRSSILHDGLILGALLEELAHRGICAPKSKIYIISEQDSLYGRVLDDLLREQSARGSCQPSIVEIGYLRGIDGEVPLAGESSSFQRSADEEQSPRQSNSSPQPSAQTVMEVFGASAQERAVGSGQFDYLSRLAGKISLDAQTDYGPIAIGVLGSDVYDKLLILQSLRSRLPGALFFTTDLDARLIGREVYKWTRNLLIASSHALEYDDAAGAGANDKFSPVFRSSYQTSFYQATKMALALAAGQQPTYDLEPRLFEIGRSGPVELGSPDAGERSGAALRVQEDGAALLTLSGLQVPMKFLLCLPLLLMLAWALGMHRLYAGHGGWDWELRKPKDQRDARIEMHERVILLLAAALLAKLLFLALVPLKGSEPFYLFEGVSVIPVLSLQLSTIVIAVALLGIVHERFHSGLARLNARFQLQPDLAEQDAREEARLREKLDEEGELTAEEVLGFLQGREARRRRYRRVLLLALGFTLLISAFIQWSGVPLLLTGALYYGDIPAGWSVPVIRAGCIFAVLLVYFASIEFLRYAICFMQQVTRREIIGWQPLPPEGPLQDHKRTMDYVVALTSHVMPVIHYPFLLLTLLLVSRSSLLEGWVWNGLVLLIIGGLLLYLLYVIARFQRQASAARQVVLERLKRARTVVTRDAQQQRKLEQAIEEIRELNSGAFVHWTQQPLFAAIALPSSSLGLLTLLLQ